LGGWVGVGKIFYYHLKNVKFTTPPPVSSDTLQELLECHLVGGSTPEWCEYPSLLSRGLLRIVVAVTRHHALDGPDHVQVPSNLAGQPRFGVLKRRHRVVYQTQVHRLGSA